MKRIARLATPLAVIALAACQGTTPSISAESASPAASETTEATATPPATSASAEPSAEASAAAISAEPIDRSVLEPALTALGCSFVNEFAQGPIWGCPGSDGSYVVSLITTGASGPIGDVLVTPDFVSDAPSQEVSDLVVGILEVAAPSASSAELEAVTDAIDSFDPRAEPVELNVAGWTAFLAAQDDGSWSLGLSASS